MCSIGNKLARFALALLLFSGVRAFAVDCYTAGFNCTNIDTQMKGSRWPAFGTDSGSANAYAVATIAPLGPSLKTGSKIIFFAAHANTSASTLVVNGVGSPIPIKKSVSTALVSGDILLNGLVEVVYDGTNFQCLSCGGGSFSSLSGTLGCSQMPTLTGDATNSLCAMTVAALHLSPTPTTCAAGSYSRGIDASGNASGCTSAGSGGGFVGVNVQTSNYTLVSGDSGKLIVMNCSSACTVTMYGSPTSTYWGWIISIGSSTATVSLNSTTFNGSSSVPALLKFQPLSFWSDATNYYGQPELVAGSGITVTPASNGITVALTNTSVTVNGTTCTLGSSCTVPGGGSFGFLTICNTTGSSDTLTSNTDFATTCTVGANSLHVGSVLEIYVAGTETFVNGTCSGGDHHYALKMGSTTLLTAQGHSSNFGSNYRWAFYAKFHVASIGASGLLLEPPSGGPVEFLYEEDNTSTKWYTWGSSGINGDFAIDTTTSQTFKIALSSAGTNCPATLVQFNMTQLY